MCRRQSTPPALPLYMTHMWLFNTLHLPQLPTPYSFVFDFGLRGTTICNWIYNVLWRYIVKPCPALPYQDFTSFEVERFSLLSRLSITRAHTSFPRGNLSRRSVPWLLVSFHSVLIGLITYNDLNLPKDAFIIKQEQLQGFIVSLPTNLCYQNNTSDSSWQPVLSI